ncbi:MAG: hypothetical protein AAFO61_02600 [Pseudomonadota bacterium]
MTSMRTLHAALFILRLSIGSFLIVWASLKFLRPEWMVNVFRNTYKLDWVTKENAELISMVVGSAQMLLALLFILGVWRTLTYGVATLMHGTGIIGALLTGSLLFKGGLLKAFSTGTFTIGYTSFPANLLWTSVATLGALIALFLLRNEDRWTVDGMRKKRETGA